MIRHIVEFFLSIRTAIWLLWLLILALFAGAFLMPLKEEFQTIHSMPLFDWLIEQPLSITWWLWCAIGAIGIIAANTIACSIESFLKKQKVTQWLLLISPQVIHLGFLFIIFAHLLSSLGGFMGNAVAQEGTQLKLPKDNLLLHIKSISLDIDSYGYLRDWHIDVEYLSGEDRVVSDRIKPNKPSLKEGFNVNVRDLQAFPQKAVLIQVSREPGAIWALLGGILFMVGIITLITLKIKMEDKRN